MKNKTINIVIALLVLAAVIFGIYWYRTNPVVTEEGQRVIPSEMGVPTTEGKLKAETFSGKLEEVNTGCFADAECYVVVDGKHVTTTMGWSQETVGSVLGVPSFGDLESHIGEEVEVYAQSNPDGTYTLYGSEGFYIKLK